MKRTKIVATIGPASGSKEVLSAMLSAGANAFRINLSHGSPEQWAGFIENIRAVAKDVPIILDTSGPEVRLLNIPHAVELEAGQEFSFSLHPTHHICYTSQVISPQPGHRVLLDDGAIALKVEGVHNGIVHSRVENGGTLTDRRKVSIPAKMLELPVLTEDDVVNVLFCLEKGADVIALSFTQRAEDIQTAKSIFGNNVFVIAKIENATGVENAEHIVHAADGIMIARGDLGVEIPLEDVPQVQKRLARLANAVGKPVIVATQMLESMTHSPRPTRAEVSDVANAILDGADAVMLSGETAMGNYPALTVRTMARIAVANDHHTTPVFSHHVHGRVSTAEAISSAASELAGALGADAIITATASGFTARMVARFRPKVPIIAVAHDERAKRLLQLTWGVTPIVFVGDSKQGHDTIPQAVQSAVSLGVISPDHLIVATAGINTRRHGSTNLIEVHRVRELLSLN